MKYLKLFENLNQGPRYSVGQKVVALSDSPISNNQYMKFISSYKIFESKRETEDIIKEILSKLPDGFYYRFKNSARGSNDRNISTAIDEYSSIDFTITKLNEDDGKIWSVDKREVNSKSYKKFMFKDIKNVLEELFEKLPSYKLIDGKYEGYVSSGSTLIGNESWENFNNSSFIKLKFELRFKDIPSFSGKTIGNDNEINDIFVGVFDNSDSEINIKESGDYYKIMCIQNNISPYDISPLDMDSRMELIDSILRFESSMDSDLITTTLFYRNYYKKTSTTGNMDKDFSIGNKSFNSMKLEKKKEALEFIKNNDIIQFTVIFKKRTKE